MKYSIFIFLVMLVACSSQSANEIIKQEITLREARRNHTLTKLTINKQYWNADTLSVYYTVDINFNSKDSSLNDSLFFIKSKDSTLLPFLRSDYNNK